MKRVKEFLKLTFERPSTIWRDSRGELDPWTVMITAILIVIAVTFSGIISAGSVQASKTRLEVAGYVVLSRAEFNTLNTKLDSIATKADAAVIAAQAAAVAAQTAATKVDLFNSAEAYLFPLTSNLTCTMTAGNTNVWSAWTEVVDSGTTTLSSRFAADAGYVSDMLFFLPSDASDGYNVELAYGASKVTMGRVAFWALASGDIAYVLPIKSRRVPAGEAVYYRMQSTGANGATVQARFRYFYE